MRIQFKVRSCLKQNCKIYYGCFLYFPTISMSSIMVFEIFSAQFKLSDQNSCGPHTSLLFYHVCGFLQFQFFLGLLTFKPTTLINILRIKDLWYGMKNPYGQWLFKSSAVQFKIIDVQRI